MVRHGGTVVAVRLWEGGRSNIINALLQQSLSLSVELTSSNTNSAANGQVKKGRRYNS